MVTNALEIVQETPQILSITFILNPPCKVPPLTAARTLILLPMQGDDLKVVMT